RDLLGLGGLVRGGRLLAAAEGGPGGAGELEAAVVAVAGVDGPVAAGLALGDLVPDGVVGGGDARTGDTEAGHDDRATGDGGELRGELDVAEVDGVALSAVRGLATNSGHRGSPGEGDDVRTVLRHPALRRFLLGVQVTGPARDCPSAFHGA